ncbi:MAG: phage tail tape measure protein, partial [Anaerolineae bacterium]
MPVEVASIMATLGLDTGPFDKGTAAAGGKIEKFGGMIGTALGGAALAGVGVAAAAIGGIGVAAFGAAGDFEAATNAIITGTGASGDALSGMEEAVKNLRGTSAGLNTDFGTLGAVVAEVSTRTGATGDALETFSGQVLDLSRLTGGDAVENTRLITRVMGDWGVAMDDSGMLMDQLFGASQTFGISVESLSAKVVQFGAPMRQMGFSLEESVALFGKWEQEGVNAELAIGSLRIAAGNFARDNIPLQQGLRDTMAAIKGASTESEGLAIAMDVFGARAGPDMAAAIREGRFELDEAITALQETGGGLADAGERALSLGDKFGIIKNQAGVALLPLGEMLLGLAEDAMPAVQSGLQWFTDTGVPAMVDFGTSVKEWLDEFSERAGPII